MLYHVNSVVVQLTISETIDKPGFELRILYLANMNNNSTNVSVLLGYGAVLLGDRWPTFRQSVLVLSSGAEKSFRNSSVSRYNGLVRSLLWRARRYSILSRRRNFSIRHHVQTVSEDPPILLNDWHRGTSPRRKQKYEDGRSTASSVEVDNAWSSNFLHSRSYNYVTWCTLKSWDISFFFTRSLQAYFLCPS
jgi:hypothetical protein